MPKAVTRDILTDAVIAAVTASRPSAAPAEIARRVAADPAIAPALIPVSRFESQTIRGIVVAAGAPLAVALARLAGVEIAEGDAATVIATLVSLAGAAYAWVGRETTTRPLK